MHRAAEQLEVVQFTANSFVQTRASFHLSSQVLGTKFVS